MTANGSDSAGPSGLEKKIIRQIEYYFGDANLSRDRFLQSKVKEDDGWVPLETMIRFNRLKTLTTDYDVIIGALAKSQSALMEVSEDKQKIRRSAGKPIPIDTTENRIEVKKRTVYCKGFSTDDSLDKVQSFLDKFGEVEHIQMRRDKDRKFKGSVFAVFVEEQSVTKLLETKDVKIGETDMIIKLKDEYFKLKTDERKQRRDDEKKEKQLVREKREQEAIEAQQADFGDFEKGCVMHFDGVTDQTSREDLKELFGEYGTISWVDFERGQTEGCVRFDEETKAEAVIEKAKADNDGKLIVRERELTVRVLEGDEEAEHWKKVYESKSKIRLRKKMAIHGRGRKFKGGRGREGGRPGRAKYEGKKTVFKDSDDEEQEGMDVGDVEDTPEKIKAEKKESSEPAVAEPSEAKPSAAEPSEAKPSAEKPAAAEPLEAKPSAVKASVPEPSVAKASAAEPSVVKASAAESSAPSGAGDASIALKAEKQQEPESSDTAKPAAVKRPLEETSEAEPAQKIAKSAD